MKIVYISSSAIPSRAANSVHVMKMCQAFVKNGHELVLLAPHSQEEYKDVTPDNIFRFYGVEHCFEIKRLRMLQIPGGQQIYAFLAALKAWSLGCDLVYCRSNPATVFAIMLRLPLIFELHAPFASKSWFLDFFIVRIFGSKFLKRIIVITHSLHRYFEINYPLSSSKIRVAPDGADPLPANVEAVVIPNRGDRLQVGYVGHLYSGKGMEVVSRLSLQCPWADFHVLGGTERDIAHWKGICNGFPNIKFHGHVFHQFVSAYISTFDVLLLPNQVIVAAHGGNGNIAEWTSPLKAFEYMSAAKPIICSDLPVLREIFEHKRNALLCSPNDLLAWTSALLKLREDPRTRFELGKNAQEDFHKHYTWSIRAKKILDTLSE